MEYVYIFTATEIDKFSWQKLHDTTAPFRCLKQRVFFGCFLVLRRYKRIRSSLKRFQTSWIFKVSFNVATCTGTGDNYFRSRRDAKAYVGRAAISGARDRLDAWWVGRIDRHETTRWARCTAYSPSSPPARSIYISARRPQRRPMPSPDQVDLHAGPTLPANHAFSAVMYIDGTERKGRDRIDQTWRRWRAYRSCYALQMISPVDFWLRHTNNVVLFAPPSQLFSW